MEGGALISAQHISKRFLVKNSPIPSQRIYLKALEDVSIDVFPGETVGVVGESGCGKSTLGRCILGLQSIDGGHVFYRGTEISTCKGKQWQAYRKKLQLIFQDPYASLNPRMSIYQSVRAPLDVFHIGTQAERTEKVKEILDYVGLGREHMDKFPHEMSGGQRQRVAIARAMILMPEFIVCDEPVSALDVSVRSQVLNLMRKMQRERNLAYLFISHDLSVVRYLCDRVAVMYLGTFCENASKRELFENPVHPYTKTLLSAIPIPDVCEREKRITLTGDVPSPLDNISGCRFHNRCPYATDLCRKEVPPKVQISDSHDVCCHRALEFASQALS